MRKEEIRGKDERNKLTKVSRRQFLTSLGITTGGSVVATLSLLAACKSAESKTTQTNTMATTSTKPSTTATTSASVTTATISTKPSTTATTPTTATTSSTQTSSDFTYTPDENPPIIDVPSSTCTIATDRLYSYEHVWVKLVTDDIVVLGVTPSMVEILGEPYQFELPEKGMILAKDDVFAFLGGWKIASDLFTPVSGEIVLVNEYLNNYKHGDGIYPIQDNPFTEGWIIAIKLSNPGELDDLLDPHGYLVRLGKGE